MAYDKVLSDKKIFVLFLRAKLAHKTTCKTLNLLLFSYNLTVCASFCINNSDKEIFTSTYMNKMAGHPP